jgi:hypothetical protein
MNADAKLKFDACAQTLGLDNTARDKTWNRMVLLNLNADDPTVLFLVLAGLLEKAAETVPTAINSIPSRMKMATAGLQESVADAAVKKLQAHQDKNAARIARAIAASATQHFAALENLRRLRVSSAIVAVACLIFLSSFIAGVKVGRMSVDGLAAASRELLGRADANSWLSLARANHGIDKQLSVNCSDGAPGAFRESGRRACRVPLWVEGEDWIAGETDRLSIHEIVGNLGNWTFLVLIGLGLLAGTLGRKTVRVLFKSRAVRWVFDV